MIIRVVFRKYPTIAHLTGLKVERGHFFIVCFSWSSDIKKIFFLLCFSIYNFTGKKIRLNIIKEKKKESLLNFV